MEKQRKFHQIPDVFFLYRHTVQLRNSPLKVYPNTIPTPASKFVIGAIPCNPGMAEDAHAHTALLMLTQHTM